MTVVELLIGIIVFIVGFILALQIMVWVLFGRK